MCVRTALEKNMNGERSKSTIFSSTVHALLPTFAVMFVFSSKYLTSCGHDASSSSRLLSRYGSNAAAGVVADSVSSSSSPGTLCQWAAGDMDDVENCFVVCFDCLLPEEEEEEEEEEGGDGEEEDDDDEEGATALFR